MDKKREEGYGCPTHSWANTGSRSDLGDDRLRHADQGQPGRASGFHSSEALISLATLKLGGLCPPLPGRVNVT